jgi:hypothetical protein
MKPTYTVQKQLYGGGLCLLAAMGPGGKFLVGVPCRPRLASKWLRARVTKRERLRLEAAVAAEYPDNPKYPCSVCGREIGWDAPSGVCSNECLAKGQGFSEGGGR